MLDTVSGPPTTTDVLLTLPLSIVTKGATMQQLSGMDASFVYFETPSTPMHVAGVSIYDPSTAPDGTVTFKGILASFQERLHLARTFRQKMVQVPMNLDHPYWVEDKDFDLEFHVRHIALPQPGDWRQLCIQVARLHSRMLDLSRPLWETYVIEGLDHVEGVPPGSFALLQKTHHAAIDGVSGMEMTSAIHDLTPEPQPPGTIDTWQGEDDPSPLTLLSRAALNNGTRPMHFGRVVGAHRARLGPGDEPTSASPVAAPVDVGTAHTASTERCLPTGWWTHAASTSARSAA